MFRIATYVAGVQAALRRIAGISGVSESRAASSSLLQAESAGHGLDAAIQRFPDGSAGIIKLHDV